MSVHAAVIINNTKFPDSAFRSYVLNNHDRDGDGVLSASEIVAVTSMDVSGRNIETGLPSEPAHHH